MKVTRPTPGTWIVECPDCLAGRTFVSRIDATKFAAKVHVCKGGKR